MKNSEILQRKKDHIDLALSLQNKPGMHSFDDIHLDHYALPDLNFDDIEASCRFLDKALKIPFLVSSMTGGPVQAERINRHLAEAAQECGVALAVGSQRIALEERHTGGIDGAIRHHAPDILLFANFGAAQLNLGYGSDEAQRAVDMIGANALIIHLNPLQESVQQGGDTNWKGLLSKLESLVNTAGYPIVVKETGCGISGTLAKALAEIGISAIDVSGRNGTNWAEVEAGRAKNAIDRDVAACFAEWGIPTSVAIEECRSACSDMPIIGSGGIRNGLDAAKAIRFGADIVGQAGPILKAALESTQAVIDHLTIFERQLKIAMFCTNSANLDDLKKCSFSKGSM